MRMLTSAHLTTKAILVSVAGGAMVLYIAYTMWAGSEADSARRDAAGAAGGAHPRPPGGQAVKQAPVVGQHGIKNIWAGKDFTGPVPTHMLETMATISVDSVEMNVSLPKSKSNKFKKIKVFYREAGKGSTKAPVLLLHGAKYTSLDWVQLKTLQLIAALGHHVIAVDLPGSGNSGKRVEDKARFLEVFLATVKFDRPVIVSPSMSGSYSLPYILKDSPQTCTSRVRGFVPVAPAATNSYDTEQYSQCKVPVMIVYGSKDTKLGKKSLEKLQNFRNHGVYVIENARHAAYLDDPTWWHNLLYNFLTALESS